MDRIGWGATLRTGKLNEDGSDRNSVSDNTNTDYFSFDIFNARQYEQYDLSVHTSLGWESLQPQGKLQDDSLTGSVVLTRQF